MENIIKQCLNNEITVYEYSISMNAGIKLSSNSILFTNGPVKVEGDVDYSKMTDEEIDEYDNKLYLSTPHNKINIKSINSDDIIQKINECHTILFIIVKPKYKFEIDNKVYTLLKKSENNVNLSIETNNNLDLFNKSKFIILTWTDFKKHGYLN